MQSLSLQLISLNYRTVFRISRRGQQVDWFLVAFPIKKKSRITRPPKLIISVSVVNRSIWPLLCSLYSTEVHEIVARSRSRNSAENLIFTGPSPMLRPSGQSKEAALVLDSSESYKPS